MTAIARAWCAALALLTCGAGCQPRATPADARPAAPTPTGSAAAALAPKVPEASQPTSLPRCRGEKPVKPSTPGPHHTWGAIAYPSLTTPWGTDGKARPTI